MPLVSGHPFSAADITVSEQPCSKLCLGLCQMFCVFLHPVLKSIQVPFAFHYETLIYREISVFSARIEPLTRRHSQEHYCLPISCLQMLYCTVMSMGEGASA